MSDIVGRKGIKSAVEKKLWLENGAHCALCNKNLTESYLGKWYSHFFANMAHIKAYSSGGPRADLEDLRNDSFDNLILVCLECHKNIDEFPEIYTENYLRKKKSEHEMLVRRALSNLDKPQYSIVICMSSILKEPLRISDKEINQYLLEEDIVASPVSSNITLLDDTNGEDVRLLETLKNNFDSRIRMRMESEQMGPICLFAFGPMYLLIRLGYLFSYWPMAIKVPIRTHSGWLPSEKLRLDYTIKHPETIHKERDVVLELAISAPENNQEIEKTFGNMDYWVITVDSPGIDIVRNSEVVDKFRGLCYGLLDRIEREYHNGVIIHVVPRLCNALSVAFGMAINPKSHPELCIYDKVGSEIKKMDVIRLN